MKPRKPCTGGEIRVARKSHQCSERSYHAIKPGDHYLFVCAPPWHDMNSSKKWWIIRACLRCAKEFGLLDSELRAVVAALPMGAA